MKSNNYFQKFCLLLLVIGVFGIWAELHKSDATGPKDGMLSLPVSLPMSFQNQEVNIANPLLETTGNSPIQALPVIVVEDHTR